MYRSALGLTCLLAAFAWTGTAWAVPITYSISGAATGTIGNVSFNDAAVTVTTFGDTSTVHSILIGGTTYLVDTGMTTVDIAGVGTATLNSADTIGVVTTVIDPTAQTGAISISDITTSVAVLTGFYHYTSVPYGLTTPFNVADSAASSLSSIPTTLGALSFSQDISLTFSASVPEPASVALFAAAIGGLLAARRRRGDAG